MSELDVMFIAGWFPSADDPVKGIFVKEHASASNLYNDVVVVTSKGVDKKLNSFCKIDDTLYDGLRVISISYRKSPVPKLTYPIYLRAMYKAFRYLSGEGFEPDVIHANIYSSGVPAVLLGKLYGLPVLITEHYSGFTDGSLSFFAKLGARFIMNRADLILPVSRYLAEHIRDKGVETDFKVIPNTVDTDIFYPDIEQRKGGRKKILMVGLLTKIKGIPCLLKATKRLLESRQDIILDIIGDGPKKQVYQNLASKLGIDEFVEFHGLKSREEVANYMRRSNLLVLPSEAETFGVVLIEALASGLPVVSTNVGGPKEIVNEDVGKLIPPGSSKQLAEGISEVLNNLNNFSVNEIRQYVEERYGKEVVGEMIDTSYRSVLGIE